MADFKKCLYCSEPLESGLYHEKCSVKLFGRKAPPTLPYTLDDLHELARRNIINNISVTGVQPKLSLDLSDARSGKLTFVGLLGDYILKPQSPDYPFLPENEALTMLMAREAGILTAQSGLLPLASGELAYLTLRIDRTIFQKNKIVKKIRHMEDFCQATEHITENKYRGSMELTAKTIRKYSTQAGYDLTRLMDILIFIFITGNGDMHLKNFSLLYNSGERILAPAYDLLSTRLVIPANIDPEEFAMPINGKKSNIKEIDFLKFAESAQLKEVQYRKAIKRFGEKIEPMIRLIRQSFLRDNMKEEYIDIVIEGAKRLNIIP